MGGRAGTRVGASLASRRAPPRPRPAPPSTRALTQRDDKVRDRHRPPRGAARPPPPALLDEGAARGTLPPPAAAFCYRCCCRCCYLLPVWCWCGGAGCGVRCTHSRRAMWCAGALFPALRCRSPRVLRGLRGAPGGVWGSKRAARPPSCVVPGGASEHEAPAPSLPLPLTPPRGPVVWGQAGTMVRAPAGGHEGGAMGGRAHGEGRRRASGRARTQMERGGACPTAWRAGGGGGAASITAAGPRSRPSIALPPTPPGERSQDQEGVLQGQGVPQAHDAQGHAVQDRQGVALRAGCARARERERGRGQQQRCSGRWWVGGVEQERTQRRAGGGCPHTRATRALHAPPPPTAPTAHPPPARRQAPLRPQAVWVRWPDQACVPQEGGWRGGARAQA